MMRRVFAPRGLRLLHATRMRNIHTLPFAGGAANSLPQSPRWLPRQLPHISVRHLQLIAHFICAFICIFSHTAAVLPAPLPFCPLFVGHAASAATCLCLLLLLLPCIAIQLSRSCISLLSVCLPALLPLLFPLLSLSVFVFGFSCLPLGLIVHLVCIFMKSLCGLCNKFNSGLFMCHPRDIYHSI